MLPGNSVVIFGIAVAMIVLSSAMHRILRHNANVIMSSLNCPGYSVSSSSSCAATSCCLRLSSFSSRVGVRVEVVFLGTDALFGDVEVGGEGFGVEL